MRAVLIMGPTASGKSALAMALAEKLGGELVNADAAQVYRDLRIVTARPAAEEEERAPHHLFGHVDAGERYSVGKWLAAATPVVAEIGARLKTPIIVGGTGLYFKALTEGLMKAPPAEPEMRAELLARLRSDGPQSLYAELAKLDPEGAKAFGPRDGARVLRALEVWKTTGMSIQALQANTTPALAAGDWVGVTLWPDRHALYKAIEDRFAVMVTEGALDEVRTLMARGLDPDLPAMKAIGVPDLMAYLRGEQKLEKAVERAQRDSRRYAKRQYTWIKGQMADWTNVGEAEPDKRVDRVLALLEGVDRTRIPL